MFVFEGIGIILPMKQTMAEPKKFKAVVTTSIAIYGLFVIVYSYVALFGFGAIRSQLPLVTESLPRKSPTTSTIKLLYCAVSIITIPLQIYPVMNIVDGYIKYGTAMSRLLIMTFCSGVALGFYNNLPHVIAVTGAISCTPLAFTLPALFHL